MKQTLIRNMQEQDIASVALIERMSFTTPWSETSFFSEIYKCQSIAKVAISEDEVVGHICAEHVLDEGHILDLAVRPDYRGRGIATLLVKSIIESLQAEGCKFLYLEVRASNAAARQLYQSFGFKIEGIRKKYYFSPAEDAVLMKLRVSPIADF